MTECWQVCLYQDGRRIGAWTYAAQHTARWTYEALLNERTAGQTITIGRKA